MCEKDKRLSQCGAGQIQKKPTKRNHKNFKRAKSSAAAAGEWRLRPTVYMWRNVMDFFHHNSPSFVNSGTAAPLMY